MAASDGTGSSPGPVAGAVSRADRFLTRVPFYPLLMAAYPVLLLYSDNVADVAAADVVVPLLLVIIITATAFGMLSLAWGAPRRAAIVVTALILPFLAFGLIAELFASMWPPHEPIVRAYLVALAVWVAVVSLSFYLASRLKARLAAVTQVLNVISVALIVLAFLPVVAYAGATNDGAVPDSAGSTSAVIAPAIAEDAERPRDIYHLVFDRYGSDEALQRGLGIDNSDFSGWLREHGFDVVDKALANYERTALSLSSVHSMSLHDELAAAMGPGNPDLGPLYDRIRNSAAATLLQQRGYRYVHVGSWFHPTAQSDIADDVEEPGFQISFVSTLIDRSAITGLEAIGTMATTLSLHGTKDKQAEVTETQFARIRALIDEPGPKFVFAHVLVPHEPYLFLEDGTFDPERATFETQLRYANAQIRDFVEPLLRLPEDEQPIIILQADEGPYPERYEARRDAFDWSTASDEELATKFGVLNAMYLPGPQGEAALPTGMTLVNTYPEILRRYLGLDVPRSPDRSYTLRNGSPYDQTDVTARLQDAIARQAATD